MSFFRKLLIVFCFCGCWTSLSAQDLNFTQFYASPLYLNPAFAGAVEQFRFASTYRNQWVQVPRSFQTNIASFDYNLMNYNSGVGAMLYSDRVGELNLSHTHFSLQYAYAIYTPYDWVIRMGLQLGYTMRRHNLSDLTFGDQIDNGGGPTAESLENFNAGFIDLGTGLLIYNERLWFGASLFRLNSPKLEAPMRLDPQNEVRDYPMRLSVHAGAKMVMRNGHFLSPSVLYQRQTSFDMLDLGFNYYFQPLMLGLWYRGLPLRPAAGDNMNQDAIALLTGLHFKAFTVGYSYDYNLNNLRGRPGGSHEISLIIQPPATRQFKRKYRGKDYIDCPAYFYTGQ